MQPHHAEAIDAIYKSLCDMDEVRLEKTVRAMQAIATSPYWLVAANAIGFPGRTSLYCPDAMALETLVSDACDAADAFLSGAYAPDDDDGDDVLDGMPGDDE